MTTRRAGNGKDSGSSKGNEYGSVAIVCPTHRDKACDEWGTRWRARKRAGNGKSKDNGNGRSRFLRFAAE